MGFSVVVRVLRAFGEETLAPLEPVVKGQLGSLADFLDNVTRDAALGSCGDVGGVACRACRSLSLSCKAGPGWFVVTERCCQSESFQTLDHIDDRSARSAISDRLGNRASVRAVESEGVKCQRESLRGQGATVPAIYMSVVALGTTALTVSYVSQVAKNLCVSC